MNSELTKLAYDYTRETANLKDYQCQARSAIFGRTMAQRFLKKCDEDGYDPFYICDYSCAAEIAKENHIEIEQDEPLRQDTDNGEPDDNTYYMWAIVPEYNSYGHAKVVLRRIGTQDGDILLPQEKRAEKRLKTSDKDNAILRTRTLKSIVEKIKNYEGQIKTERSRLTEQIRNNDNIYMEAEAVQLKRICDKMQEDLDDFLNMLNR